MVFSSLIFLYAFLPVCLILYACAPGIRSKNIILLILSLVFYAWGEPVWVSLLFAISIVNYCGGLMIGKYHGRWQAKTALITTLVFNLGLLGAFKYLNFFLDNLGLLWHHTFMLSPIALPIGLSFYVFQALSYNIDLYRDQTQVQTSFVKFFLFISLFPQLVAGPILRYSDIAPQLSQRQSTWPRISYGLARFLCGLGKKVLLANFAGQTASTLLNGQLESLGAAGAWLGLLMFAFQIYFDFSGYSDMAIGLGRIFGFTYKENFLFPYTAKSITDFWRTWHISLGAFFRDYVYIPLGGNRRFQMRNILIVWFLTGLWHGASWNFILWGLYFGCILVLEKYFLLKILRVIPRIFSWLYAFVLILFGWVFFYFTDLAHIGAMFQALFGLNGAPLYDFSITTLYLNNLPLCVICICACTPLPKYLARRIVSLNALNAYPDSVLSGLSMLIYNLVVLGLSTIALVGASYNPFLYFRF
ncbi:MAG: MBOAT family protein [Peptococcaceae bacterium]|nr:MBOAT family protein [Peptococcaceae bacterium]